MNNINIKEYVKNEMLKLKTSAQAHVKLGIIDATDSMASRTYIRNKIKDFEELGWEAKVYEEDSSVPQAVERAVEDGCTAIMAQLPTKEGVTFDPTMVPPEYDCDGFHPMSYCLPATARGVMEYLREVGFCCEGSLCVVVGQGMTAGKPIADELRKAKATVATLNSKTPWKVKNILLKDADLVVVATGRHGVVCREDCPHALVIDVGINFVDGKMCGDFIENEETKKGECWSTPVPGGVGLLTRLGMLRNCLDLVKKG